MPSSWIESEPTKIPCKFGSKKTEIVHEDFGSNVFPQLVVFVKNCGEANILLIASVPDPVLVRVTLCAELFVSTVWGAKVMLVADKEPTPPDTRALKSGDGLGNAFLCIEAMLSYALSGWITGVAVTLCFNFIAQKTAGIDAKFVTVAEDASSLYRSLRTNH